MAEQVGFHVGDRFVDAWGRDIEQDEVLDADADPGYAKMSAKDLQALAKERELDLTGVTKKSEVIALLEAADAAAAEADDEDND